MESQSSRAAAKNSWLTGMDTAFALDRLDADAADIVGELGAKIGDVVEADELDSGHHGQKGSRYFSLCVVATEPMVRPWKLWSRARNFVPMLLALGAEASGVGASEFQRGLPGFGAAVAEEDAVEAAHLSEAQSEVGGVLVEEEVRRVEQPLALAGDGLLDGGMTIAKRGDTDAAEQIEVVIAVLVAEIDAVAADEELGDCARRCGAAVCSPLPGLMLSSCDHDLRSVVDSCGAEVRQERCGLRRQDANTLYAVSKSLAAGIELGQHAAGDDLLFFDGGNLRQCEPAHHVAVCSFDAGNVGQKDKRVGLGGDGAGGCHLVGVDVVVLAVEAQRNGRDDGNRTHRPDGLEPAADRLRRSRQRSRGRG